MFIGLTGLMSIICLYRSITAGKFYQQLIAYIGAILCLLIMLLLIWGLKYYKKQVAIYATSLWSGKRRYQASHCFVDSRKNLYEKVSASLQNKCSLVLLIFRIWPFSANAYRPKLLAIFFSDRKFLLDSKYLEFAIQRSHDLDSG